MQKRENANQNGGGFCHFQVKSPLKNFQTLTHQISLFSGLHTLRSLQNIFYYVNDEFLIYCYIYQFILCNCAGWGKLSEKTFKDQQNNCTFRILAISRAYGSPYP